MSMVNELSKEAKLESAPLLDKKLAEVLDSESIPEKQRSQAILQLRSICKDLELYSTVDAVAVSAQITELLLSEIKKGGSIIIKYKSGVSSKLILI